MMYNNKNIIGFVKMSSLVILIDMIYLKLIKNYFNEQIRLIQGSNLEMDYIAAILAYVFICIVLYYFIINQNRTIQEAFLLGLSIYMIYELTNKGIIKNWKWKTVLLDGIWGGILFSLVTYLYMKI